MKLSYMKRDNTKLMNKKGEDKYESSCILRKKRFESRGAEHPRDK